ncbi:hypothetical protein GQ597_03470 [Gilliamella sp. Pra-s65]|uniref:hypothetical protein n=1 Tax=unclassified Gilliamella TaxID=2685620 RepID=UPI001366671E|nr:MULTISPECIES: hypothetical protein [unclassified Gilliamella]MWN89771.1 hypothetical protein [Gilliamella sp. Pra-s65]MWP72943.1 hypothetical protein [Gilliamella sp. Pra-s52]
MKKILFLLFFLMLSHFLQMQQLKKIYGNWVSGLNLEAKNDESKYFMLTADLKDLTSRERAILAVNCKNNNLMLNILNVSFISSKEWSLMLGVDQQELIEQKIKLENISLSKSFNKNFFENLEDKQWLSVTASSDSKTINMIFGLEGFKEAFEPILQHCTSN